jgi:segregation and condensation protein B
MIFDYSMSENFLTPDSLMAMIEAMLFAAPTAVTPTQLGEASDRKSSEVDEALKNLEQRYSLEGGLRLKWHKGKVELTTAPEFGPQIEKFLGLEANSRLSRAGVETLSIVAYKQPITRPGIDAIRGVNSDGVIKSLLLKGMIEESGRAEGPGRPILYSTTSAFLQQFGLRSIDELPPFDYETSADEIPDDNQLLKD